MAETSDVFASNCQFAGSEKIYAGRFADDQSEPRNSFYVGAASFLTT